MGGRKIPPHGIGHRDHPHHRPSAGLCRVARRARRADGAGLRPLRRAAGRSAGEVDHARRSSRPGANGNLYARGATDDKGQMFTHIDSAEAWLDRAGRLPVQLKFLIEGEEEVGSRGLEEYLPQAADRLACDCVVISDGGKFAPTFRPSPTACAGIAYYEIRVTGPNRDLHSGSFGGSVTNPANAVAQILAAMIDAAGKVQIPGFYDDVVPLTDRERQEFAALPFDEAEYFAEIGVQRGGRRGGLHDAGTPLGAADVRCLRPLGRLSGRRGEDRLARHGRGQVQLPPGAQPRAGEDHRRA